MALFVAGLVVVLLFVATYSQRRTWIALGSAALSVALVLGCAFFSAIQGPSRIHDGLTQLARQLPAGWDQPALKLTAALERASTSLANARKQAAPREPGPVLATSIFSISEWFDWGSDADTSAKAEPDPEAAPARQDEPASAPGAAVPIKWFLDAPGAAAAGETFAVRGANVSDQPLKVLRAVLKPDSGGKRRLTFEVAGKTSKSDAVIPPGARFSLIAPELSASEAEQLGGAILSVAYVQAGRRKASIMYLTPAMLAARAPSD